MSQPGACLLAIDPGPKESAYVLYKPGGGRVISQGTMPNEKFTDCFLHHWREVEAANPMAIEVMRGFGIPAGQEVFETCEWVGRFIQAWGGWVRRIGRKEVKAHLCGHTTAKDSHVREALIHRYGGKEAAIGKKAKPGPLYGVTGDQWSALAVAITAAETTPSPTPELTKL